MADRPAPTRFAEGPAGRVRTPFTWGFIEATFFVIIPDVAIGWVALHSLRGGMRAAGWAVVGATLGGILVYLWPTQWQALFQHLPGIPPAMMGDAAARFAQDGWWAMVAAPVAGIPYKLYAAEAGVNDAGMTGLILITPIARAWRFVAVAFIFAGIGRVLRRPLAAHPWPLFAVYIGFWVLNYILYFRVVEATYG